MRNRASPRRRTPQFCSKRTTSTTGLHRSKGDENDTGLLSESMLQAKSSIDHSWICVLLTFAALFIPHSQIELCPLPWGSLLSVAIYSEWVGVNCVPWCRARGWKGAWSEDRNLESRSFSAAKIRKETGRGGVTTARETTSQEKLLRSFQVNSHLGVQLRRLEDLFRSSTRSPAKTPDSSLLLQPFRCPSVSANITFAVLPSISGLASSRADWNLQIVTGHNSLVI